jgi:hypothetical protein
MSDSPLAAFGPEPQSVTPSTENSPFDAIMEKGSPKPTTSSASPHDSLDSEVSPEDHEVHQDNTRPGEVLPEVMASESSPEANASTKGFRNSAKSCASSDHSGSAGSTSSTDEYEQEPFDTYKLKVVQLCQDIGWGEPSQVERMTGGGFNRITGLSFSDRPTSHYVLRVPRNGTIMAFEKRVSEDIKDQAALLRYLSQFIPVASVAAFDSTKSNAIASPFILQERLPGQRLDDVYYKLPLSEKLQITTMVAELMQKLETLKLDEPGRIAADSALPSLMYDFIFSPKDIKIVPYRDSQLMVAAPMHAVERDDFTLLMRSLLEHRKNLSALADQPYRVEMWERLQKIASEMENAGLVRISDRDCVIWHWDFEARNIMINRLAPSTNETANAIDTKCFDDQASQAPEPEQKDFKSKKCQHKVHIGFNSHSETGINYTIDVNLEESSVENCKHHISTTVEDTTGKKFHHTLEIIDNKSLSTDVQQAGEAAALPTVGVKQQQESPRTEENSAPWVITGVLDWDDILSGPLVLTRKPPLWLWCNGDDRSNEWSGNLDVPPARELTQDELLIKAHFNQIMEKYSPSYIEDAYHRGPWLRRLASFALYGFTKLGCEERYHALVDEWEEYYQTVAGRGNSGENLDEETCSEETGERKGSDVEGDEVNEQRD